jgi:hypothetical protein
MLVVGRWCDSFQARSTAAPSRSGINRFDNVYKRLKRLLLNLRHCVNNLRQITHFPQNKCAQTGRNNLR